MSSAHAIPSSLSPFAASDGVLALAGRWGLASEGRIRLARLLALAIGVAWAPLLLLSLLEGRAIGERVALTFRGDYLPHGRFAAALSLLLALDPLVERRTALALEQFRSGRLLSERAEIEFGSLVERASRLAQSRFTSLLLLAAAYAGALLSHRLQRSLELSSWAFDADAGLSLAGAWSVFVSAPLLRLLLLRAVWRWLLWVWLLLRIARLDLRINPLHPDKRCGLLFLGESQLAYSLLIAAVGVQVGCLIADAVQYRGVELAAFHWPIAGFVVLSVSVFAAPLFAFVGWIVRAREEGEYDFSSWAALVARRLRDHIRVSQADGRSGSLTTPEFSEAADAGQLFDRVLAIRPVPAELRQLLIVLAAAILSVAAPLLTLLPLAEIGRLLARALF